jgi:hypothetical protein
MESHCKGLGKCDSAAPASILENQDFPHVFVDPRHSPAYKDETFYQQAANLQQYSGMVVYFFKYSMEEDGRRRMREILTTLQGLLPNANAKGYFSYSTTLVGQLPDVEKLVAAVFRP